MMAKATRKRILSLLMTLVLAFSLLPTAAFAAEDAATGNMDTQVEESLPAESGSTVGKNADTETSAQPL